MGASLWTLVDRYEGTLSFLRGHVAQLRERLLARSSMGLATDADRGQFRAWVLVLDETEQMAREAAAGAEKCEGPRAAG